MLSDLHTLTINKKTPKTKGLNSSFKFRQGTFLEPRVRPLLFLKKKKKTKHKNKEDCKQQ